MKLFPLLISSFVLPCNLLFVKIMVDLSRCAFVSDSVLPGASSVDRK
jgi:hypothetical protein